ncbi:glycosyltransferase family 2 protein [Microvirga rosea]|uniref:glycosyltransferase family 2 protein n=1 Tax=Microvirga rosea TaxID=2715425 RepID=UPI001D0A05CB|nr:glycosyltransferase family A protein [Microvirga rosea]MCB8823450.1 glycosyltransferase family 2 protein [Microvirga rosea]
MSDVKLSICIPTYNRAPFLRKALTYCEAYAFDFPYEIIISDNASTDETTEVVAEFVAKALPIRYYRRATNGGGAPNLACAFRESRGEYALYLADDDLLIPDAVQEAVRYLDANPDVTACYAPWYMYDEVQGVDVMPFYSVDQDCKFPRGSFSDMFEFVVGRHVFPEIGIYRSSAWRSILIPYEFCFWAFVYLAHFLDHGSVAFLRRPFYRSVTNSLVAHQRPQAGAEEVMTAWDRYRGGLEYLLHVGNKRWGLDMSSGQRVRWEQMCKIFTLTRMTVALRFWIAKKDFIKAYELYTRITVGGLGDHPEVAKVRDTLPLMVAVQNLAWQVNSVAGLKRVVLSGVDDAGSLEGLLRELGLNPDIEVHGDGLVKGSATIETTAVFVPNPEDRTPFLAQGYLPNLVFSEEDLVRNTVL